MDAEAAAPAPPAVEVRRLAPQARWVKLLGSLLGFAFLAIVLLLVDFLWLPRVRPRWPVEPGTLAAVLLPLLLVRAIVYPFLWHRAWSYVVRERDLLVQHGVLWRVKRAVPRQRIQHVDMHSGPIDRAFGLCDLTLFTAGTADEDARIPGLLEADAERLRDELLGTAPRTGA